MTTTRFDLATRAAGRWSTAVLAAIVAAPLAFVLAMAMFLALSLVDGGAATYGGAAVHLDLLLFMAVAALGVSAAHVLVLFVPACLLLHRFGTLTLDRVTFAGAVCAALPALALSVAAMLEGDARRQAEETLVLVGFAAVCGALGGMAFWWAWRRAPPPSP